VSAAGKARPATTHLGLARIGPPCAAIGLAALGDPRSLVLVVPLLAWCHFVKRRAIPRALELALYALLAGLVVVFARSGAEPRGGAPTTIALVCAAYLAVRAVLAPAFAAKGADLALVMVAATAVGAPPQRFLPFGPVATALVALAAAADLPRGLTPGAVLRAPRRLLPTALFLALAVGVGVGAGKLLPRFTYRYATRMAKALWDRPRSGFDEELFLADGDGGAPGILESDTVVMKVNGANVDHLRGKVYDVFDGRRWHGINMIAEASPPELLPPRDDRKPVTVEAVRPSHVYFAPLDRAVRDARSRDGGVAKGPLRATWDLLAAAPVAPPPSKRDLQTERAFPEEVRTLANEWTAGAVTDEARLRAIEEHLLRDYRYTLKREGFQGSALHDFLFVHRAGHCELFATAFALLARAVGVPTRVIGGYRVLEPGPLGGTYVVRERHAHAWVEAYHGGSWHTWDPTPASAFTRKAPAWERALDALSEPAVAATLGGGTVLLALGIVARVLIVRRRAAAARVVHTLHPELARLERGLAREGIFRASAEGLLTFALRLEAEGDLAAARAARACAYLVYGQEGTLAELSALVDARVGAAERG